MEYIATFDTNKKEYQINGKNILDIDYISELINEIETDFLATKRKDSMEELTEGHFQAFLQTIFMRLFSIHTYFGYNYKSISNLQSIIVNDDNILMGLANWFVFYARSNGKTCNVYNYSILIGYSYDNILAWSLYKPDLYNGNSINNISINDNEMYRGVKLTPIRYDIVKKIMGDYEQSLQAMLVSNKGNPVGIIATLNHRFNWGGVEMRTESKTNLISADSLPKLEPPKKG